MMYLNIYRNIIEHQDLAVTVLDHFLNLMYSSNGPNQFLLLLILIDFDSIRH